MANALRDAVKENNVALVKELIERGVNINGVEEYGYTALWWAVNGRFVECAKALLEAKADVDKTDPSGWTPLHEASDNGHMECVKLLIDWKANVNTKTAAGDSPLHVVVRRGHLACAEMLIRAGAELDARTNYSYTPLANAIYFNKPDVAELLLDKGAKMSDVRVRIPDWMNAIITKRQNVRQSLTTFTGILRKRFAVSGGGTEYTRGRLPRDVVGVISRWAWSTRFDGRWEGAVVLETVKKLKSSCNHKCKDKDACAHKCCKR